MGVDKVAMDRGILIARVERLVKELRDARRHDVPIRDEYAKQLEKILDSLPRLGAPDEVMNAIPASTIEVAEQLASEATKEFRVGDHRYRVIPKLIEEMSKHSQILLTGPPEQTAATLRELPYKPPENVSRIARVDASGLSLERHESHELFLRVAHMLGVPKPQLDGHEGYWYLQVLRAIEAEYPSPPAFAGRSEYPATYVVVQNCEPELAGFICCNLRDELWQVTGLRWIWAMEEPGLSPVLRPPTDFFNRQIDLGTGFDHVPHYHKGR